MYSATGTLHQKDTLSELESTCRKLCSTPDTSLNTPLHVAAKLGHLNVIDLLLREELVESGHVSLDAKNKTYKTPAHLAAENGHVRLVQLLQIVACTLFSLSV